MTPFAVGVATAMTKVAALRVTPSNVNLSVAQAAAREAKARSILSALGKPGKTVPGGARPVVRPLPTGRRIAGSQIGEVTQVLRQ